MADKKAVLYIRVSTFDQNSENQLPDLRRYCEFRQWEIAGVFRDDGISGAKKTRPQLEEMMKGIRAGKYDVLLVWSYDRFARSTTHLVTALDELKSLNVHFASYKQQIDTTTPMGNMMFTVFAGIAQFERDMIALRTRAALARLKAQGKKLGRPSEKSEIKIQEAVRLREEGQSIRQIATTLGMSKTWVHGIISCTEIIPPVLN